MLYKNAELTVFYPESTKIERPSYVDNSNRNTFVKCFYITLLWGLTKLLNKNGSNG